MEHKTPKMSFHTEHGNERTELRLLGGLERQVRGGIQIVEGLKSFHKVFGKHFQAFKIT
jgi:hypothetical protein